MKKTKKRIPGVIALSLVVAMVMVMASGIASAAGVSVLTATPAGQSIHGKINMSDITGEIAKPPQLTSAASAVAKEKQWYEYIYYSPEPVAHFYVTDTTRLSFYDPYDYADALVMEVNDTITDWSSMNTLQVSYTTGNSITDTTGQSTGTTTTVEPEYSKETTTTTGPSVVTTTVDNRTNSYNTSKTVTTEKDDTIHWGLNESLSNTTTVNVEAGLSKVVSLGGSNSTTIEGGASQSWVSGEKISTTEVISTEKDEEGKPITGYTKSHDVTKVETGSQEVKVKETIEQRTTTATGYSANSSVSLSTDNSTTITKTYDAAYFNASGSPLQWKVVQYTVKMPMKYQVEYLVDGEWIFGDYNYCLLNTVQGTCRAWLQNSVAYYEHWGNGEPVTWNEFWSQFFTEESLVQAHQNRLYPEY